MIFARLNAMIDGFGGKYVEAHALDAKTAKRIPKRMTGRTLTADEAAKVLDRRVLGHLPSPLNFENQ